MEFKFSDVIGNEFFQFSKMFFVDSIHVFRTLKNTANLK